MNGSNWLDEEPKAGVFVHQALTLLGAGLRRPWLTLLAAVLLAGAVFGVLRFGKHDYSPRLVLRLVEAEGDTRAVPRPKGQLASYVREGVFTSGPLLEVIRRHGLYPALARNNPRAAVDSFREDIDVEVYQNYFVEDRRVGGAPRTARVALSYRTSDPALALAVTRDLGALVTERERAARRDQARRSAAEAVRLREFARLAFTERAREVAQKEQEIERSEKPDPELVVELVSLLASLEALERQTELATRRASDLELGAALEGAGIGLHFELAEDASVPSPAERKRALILATSLTFLFGLPLAATAIGAFEPRRFA